MKPFALLLLLGLPLAAPLAQENPGPEHKKLDYFVGRWSFEGEAKQGPWGPGGSVARTETCELMEGGFFLVIHTEGTDPRGPSKGLAVMGYNAEDRVFSYHGFDSHGTYQSGKGNLKGDTWSWSGKRTIGDKELKVRRTLKVTSSTSYELKEEMAADGVSYAPFLEGAATKVK